MKYDIALTCGVFDLFHKGHKELFDLMKKNADYLVVVVHDDKSTFENKSKFPVQSKEQRMKNIEALGVINSIMEVQTANPKDTLDKFIRMNEGKKIVYVRGDDWLDFPGKDIIEKHKIPIIYKKYTEGISSTLIRENLKK